MGLNGLNELTRGLICNRVSGPFLMGTCAQEPKMECTKKHWDLLMHDRRQHSLYESQSTWECAHMSASDPGLHTPTGDRNCTMRSTFWMFMPSNEPVFCFFFTLFSVTRR